MSSSPSSSTDSSSDLDTESTGSFFHDSNTTLGSLIGVPRIVNLSRRSLRRTANSGSSGSQKNYRSKTWCFSLCPTNTTDAENATKSTPSLGQFLAVERRAAHEHRNSSYSSLVYGPDEIANSQLDREPNSLFVNGHIAPPPRSSPWSGSSDINRRQGNELLGHSNNEQGVPLMFPCICG